MPGFTVVDQPRYALVLDIERLAAIDADWGRNTVSISRPPVPSRTHVTTRRKLRILCYLWCFGGRSKSPNVTLFWQFSGTCDGITAVSGGVWR